MRLSGYQSWHPSTPEVNGLLLRLREAQVKLMLRAIVVTEGLLMNNTDFSDGFCRCGGIVNDDERQISAFGHFLALGIRAVP